MTNEKIIANIERYISTVSKEQQQHFEQALEIAEKEHKPVKKYFFDTFKVKKANVIKIVETA